MAKKHKASAIVVYSLEELTDKDSSDSNEVYLQLPAQRDRIQG